MLMHRCAGSKQVAEFGYEPATGTMQIRFHSGGLYRYDDVPASLFEAFMHAHSKGRFVKERMGGLKYEKIG